MCYARRVSEINFTWDTSGIAGLTGPKFPRLITRVVAWAGRDAIKAVKAASTRSVRFRKRIKVRTVNDSLPLVFPKSGAELGDLVWTMKASGKPIPIVAYPHAQTRRGVRVSINKNGGSKVITSAFVATMKSGHTGVFQRRGKDRLPIEEKFSTKVSDVFLDAGMVPAVLARGQTVFSQTINRRLPQELAKLK